MKALIHDFGRCLPIDENDIENSGYYKTSLLSFCNEFIVCSTRKDLFIPVEIISLVKKIKRITEETEMNLKFSETENLDSRFAIILTNLKHIYENKLFPLFL